MERWWGRWLAERSFQGWRLSPRRWQKSSWWSTVPSHASNTCASLTGSPHPSFLNFVAVWPTASQTGNLHCLKRVTLCVVHMGSMKKHKNISCECAIMRVCVFALSAMCFSMPLPPVPTPRFPPISTQSLFLQSSQFLVQQSNAMSLKHQGWILLFRYLCYCMTSVKLMWLN